LVLTYGTYRWDRALEGASQFGIIDGVIRTRVGYAGGRKKNPDYHNLGDHTEAVQVDYDPRRISYEQLL